MPSGRIMLLGAALIAALVATVGYLLPGDVVVVRTIDMGSPRAAVFQLVGDLRHFAEWSPWLDADSDTVVSFPMSAEGIGQSMVWASGPPSPTLGRATIIETDGIGGVEISLELGGIGPATAWFALGVDGATTTVKWSVRTELGPNPLAHYLAPRIDAILGRDLERGLLRLKVIAQAQPVVG